MSHLERWRVVHRLQLMRDGFNDFRAAVSCVDTPQARDGVEYLSAFRGPVVHSGGSGEDAGLGLELAVGRERHPVRLEIGGGQCIDGRGQRDHGRHIFRLSKVRG